MEILDEAPTIFQTPRKRRSKKLKEKLDDGFLRRSSRLSKKSEGYKNAESARRNKQASGQATSVGDSATSEDMILEPTPLAIIPGPAVEGPAPYLSKDILKGIATGFL